MMPRRRLNAVNASHHRVIQRTTSESLRIDNKPDPIAAVHHHRPSNLPSLHGGKKTSASTSASASASASFVVTGVSTLASFGDSPDDLSEEFSRQTDDVDDTPSFSEDTSYSQYTEDVDYCACEDIILKRCVNAVMNSTENLLQSAPVPPALQIIAAAATTTESTSSQEVQSPATESVSVSMQHMPSPGRFIGRFQVVKVESIHPFRRGRWICHDYVDNSEYAPRDGYEFFQGNFIKRKELEEMKKKMEDETLFFAEETIGMQPVTIVHNSAAPLVFMNAPVLSSHYHPIMRTTGMS